MVFGRRSERVGGDERRRQQSSWRGTRAGRGSVMESLNERRRALYMPCIRESGVYAVYPGSPAKVGRQAHDRVMSERICRYWFSTDDDQPVKFADLVTPTAGYFS